MDKNVLLAGIEINKFRFLESDFGSFPKGLIYGLGILDTWLYNKDMPFDTLETVKYLDGFKEHLEDGYFEKLIEKYLLNNKHHSVVSISPEPGLTTKKDDKLKEELRKYKETLSKDDIQKLIQDTKNLKKFQEDPTPDEDLLKIPMLKREDLRREIRPLTGKPEVIDGINVMNNDIETNGIQYIELTFLPRGLEIEEIPAVSLYSKILGMVDTEHYSYGELTTRINVCSGGISTDVRSHGLTDDTCLFGLCTKAKMLYENSAEAEELITEILFHSVFTDKKRIREIILQEKAQMEGYLISSGHSAASLRAGSYFSGAALLGDYSSGISYFRYLQKFENDFDGEYKELMATIEKCRNSIFDPSNLYINNIGRGDAQSNIKTFVAKLKAECLNYTRRGEDQQEIVSEKNKDREDYRPGYVIGTAPGEFEGKRPVNEGFKTAGQIQYVCRAGNFHNAGHSYNGTMRLLKVILGYDYFWINVRVKGGAYGCMSGFSRTGIMHFVSYRDPNLKNTVDIFEETDKYLEEFDPNDRTMTKYIIGTISSIDTPLTPNQEGMRNFLMYMLGYTEAELQKERNAILDCQPEDVRALAPIVRDTLKQGYICTIGNEEKLKESADLFESVENLI
jgi:Zn-dependent M16 (insulinase) family peptidase